ncbi:hypothetical protein BgiBS90_012516 [Biomphalaria glabrata]|nr:hypothetical protein BgiBS90_012516 [Biomphalaria glabrata]
MAISRGRGSHGLQRPSWPYHEDEVAMACKTFIAISRGRGSHGLQRPSRPYHEDEVAMACKDLHGHITRTR